MQQVAALALARLGVFEQHARPVQRVPQHHQGEQRVGDALCRLPQELGVGWGWGGSEASDRAPVPLPRPSAPSHGACSEPASHCAPGQHAHNPPQVPGHPRAQRQLALRPLRPLRPLAAPPASPAPPRPFLPSSQDDGLSPWPPPDRCFSETHTGHLCPSRHLCPLVLTSQRSKLRPGVPDSLAQANWESEPRPWAPRPHTLPRGAHPPLPEAHVGADLRQAGQQVQHAGDRADDEADDLLLSEGLRGQGAAQGSRRGERCNVTSQAPWERAMPLGRAGPHPARPCHTPTPHLTAGLHGQERPAPEDLLRGSRRASAPQQRDGTRHARDEQQHGIDGGRHWTGDRREAEVRYQWQQRDHDWSPGLALRGLCDSGQVT